MYSQSLDEANRVMTICNACRYCEGFCAVFPAMELRRVFTEADLKYMANLCHNCRGCYYACQYAPPHEFNLNVPQTLGRLRTETYEEFAWPASFKGLFRRNSLAVSLITLLCVAGFTLFGLLFNGSDSFFSPHEGPGAFYDLIPYSVMVGVFSLAALFVVVAFWKGACNLWKATAGSSEIGRSGKFHLGAIWDVLRLRYLEGGGDGCNYPDEEFSMQRRYMHHLTFYGFMLCFAATIVAMFYDDVLGIPAPFAIFSLPVVLGMLGGVSLTLGVGGLFILKRIMDTEPAYKPAFPMDMSFILLLLFVTLSGLVLLFFRSTGAMGTLLCLHLGFVLALFLTMPYGKFVHSIYRYTALVRYNGEQYLADKSDK